MCDFFKRKKELGGRNQGVIHVRKELCHQSIPSRTLSVMFRADYSDSLTDFTAKKKCPIPLKSKILWQPKTSLSTFTTLLLVEILQKPSSDTSPESPYQGKRDDGELSLEDSLPQLDHMSLFSYLNPCSMQQQFESGFPGHWIF